MKNTRARLRLLHWNGRTQPAWGQPISERRAQELQKVLNTWSRDTDNDGRRGPFAGMRLTGADVSWLARYVYSEHPDDHTRLPLQNANLARAQLAGADVGAADLHGANLAKANLQRADLRSADLRGTNLQGTTLRYASIHPEQLACALVNRYTDITHADLRPGSLRLTVTRDFERKYWGLIGPRWARGGLLLWMIGLLSLGFLLHRLVPPSWAMMDTLFPHSLLWIPAGDPWLWVAAAAWLLTIMAMVVDRQVIGPLVLLGGPVTVGMLLPVIRFAQVPNGISWNTVLLRTRPIALNAIAAAPFLTLIYCMGIGPARRISHSMDRRLLDMFEMIGVKWELVFHHRAPGSKRPSGVREYFVAAAQLTQVLGTQAYGTTTAALSAHELPNAVAHPERAVHYLAQVGEKQFASDLKNFVEAQRAAAEMDAQVAAEAEAERANRVEAVAFIDSSNDSVEGITSCWYGSSSTWAVAMVLLEHKDPIEVPVIVLGPHRLGQSDYATEFGFAGIVAFADSRGVRTSSLHGERIGHSVHLVPDGTNTEYGGTYRGQELVLKYQAFEKELDPNYRMSEMVDIFAYNSPSNVLRMPTSLLLRRGTLEQFVTAYRQLASAHSND